MSQVEIRIWVGEETDYSIGSGVLSTWEKDIGAEINKGELLCTFETDKAVVEVESPVSGVLEKILTPEGTTVSTKRYEENSNYLSKVIAIIESSDAKSENSSNLIEEENEAPPIFVDKKTDKKVKRDFETEIVKPKIKKTERESLSVDFLITPEARAYARESGISEEQLNKIQGSGPDNCIVRTDLNSHSSASESIIDKSEIVESDSNSEMIKQSPIREAIALEMEKANEKPLVGVTLKVCMKELVHFKERYDTAFEKHSGAKFQMAFPLFVAFVRVAHRLLQDENKEMKQVLGRWEWKDIDRETRKGFVIQYHNINAGMAFDTPRGLVVLAVENADQYSLFELAQKVSELGQKAQEAKFTPQDLHKETFIFNSIGGKIKTPEEFNGRQVSAYVDSGESLPTDRVSIIFNFASLDDYDDAKLQLRFDHRVLDGKLATMIVAETYFEMIRVIDELGEELKNPDQF